MSTHNLGLHGKLKQVVHSLSSNTQLRCLLSTVSHGDNVFGTNRRMSGGDEKHIQYANHFKLHNMGHGSNLSKQSKATPSRE